MAFRFKPSTKRSFKRINNKKTQKNFKKNLKLASFSKLNGNALKLNNNNSNIKLKNINVNKIQKRNATIAQIRMRMKSVANIGKITKAMQMVSAAKKRAVEKKLKIARGILKHPVTETWNEKDDIATKSENGEVATEGKAKKPKHLLVGFTSNRGLCGGINGNVCKRIIKKIEKDGDKEDFAITLVGEKGRAGLERLHADKFVTTMSDNEIDGSTNWANATAIANEILAQPFDKGTIIYNKYISAIAYETIRAPIRGQKQVEEEMALFEKFETDTDEDETLRAFHEFRTAVGVYSYMIDGQLAEQSSRMNAMDNSTKNAEEMVEKLTLQYNKGRQAKITTELIEIMSGASASESLAEAD